MNRKPLTEVEIIDECDEFLDSFSNNRIVNIDRLQNSLVSIMGVSEKAEEELEEIAQKIKDVKRTSVRRIVFFVFRADCSNKRYRNL